MEVNAVVVGSMGLGAGDENLGGILLANFLRLLGERESMPCYVILWNEGVKLALEDSMWINHLRNLESKGVKVILCRTCVEYFGLEGKTAVGEIGNMAQIQDILLKNISLTV